jgi:hypothetical protein
MYNIYDENGDLMRRVRYLAEAKYIVSIREGWSYKRMPKKRLDLSIYMEAPF